MKVPDVFKPEKNLEKKTEKLLQEKKNTSNPKPTGIEQKELEELLNDIDEYGSLDNKSRHIKIDSLIRKSDYQCLNIKGCYWQYWSKPSAQNFDESYVFIRSSDKYEHKHYAFARVDNNKLEDFCRLFEKYETGVLSGINHNKPYFHLGMITGGISGTTLFIINPTLLGSATFFIPLAGFLVGMLGGTKLSKYKHQNYAKKLVKHYEELDTYSLHAIKKAFERQ